MGSEWICIVIRKTIASKGEEAVQDEIRKLAGPEYITLHLADDEFDGEQYAFLKCHDIRGCIENLRSSPVVSNVLASYDYPTVLSGEEVSGFVSSLHPSKEVRIFNHGDIVEISGDHEYAGLYGVVLAGGDSQCFVTFKFHTLTNRLWVDNSLMEKVGSVFNWLKFPVIDVKLFESTSKYPVIVR